MGRDPDESWNPGRTASLTPQSPGLGGLRSVGKGFCGLVCHCLPVLAHPEFSDPLLEAVAEAFVAGGPEATGAAYL